MRSEKFQFHKGTIRTGDFKYSIKDKVNFNSIKVRLELRDIGVGIGSALGFQFHKGTIRTQRS